jgi:hypothetical protein
VTGGKPFLRGRFFFRKTGFTGCGKIDLFGHSERSEESLFALDAGKERFLGAQRASERQKFEFYRKVFSVWVSR